MAPAALLALAAALAGAAADDAQLRTWKQAAQSGDAEAAYRLGRAYKLGDPAPLDAAEAERWFEKAARLGLPSGEAEYGLVLYQNGKRREAVPWLRKAAERGDRRAQYALGTILFNGIAAPKDVPEARRWMQRAAKAGLPAAAEALAVMAEPVLPDPRVDVVEVRPVRQVISAKPATGGWRVQVGAFSSRANAERLWARLKLDRPPALAPSFRSDGRLTRVQIGPFDTAAGADAFCRRVRSISGDCFRISPGSG